MQRSVYQHKILDTIQPSGADIVVKNRYLYIAGNLMWKMDDVERNGVTKVVAVSSVTQGVITFAVPATPANSTVYTVQATVSNPGAQGAQDDPLVFNISVTTPSTGTLTDATLVTQFKNLINSTSQSYNTYFVASGSTTLILTATTAYPVLIGSSPQSSAITETQTTQGAQLVGQVSDMLALGVVQNTTPVSLGRGNPTNTLWLTGTSGTLSNTATSGYNAYICESALDVGETNTLRANQKFWQILWVNNADTNAAAFCSILDAVLAGFLRNGTTINPHELEVQSYNPSNQ